MMVIRRLFILTSLLLMAVGCEQQERPVYSNEYGRFIRFNLQVTNDGETIEPGEVNPSARATDVFTQKTVNTLAIPVTITSEALSQEVEAYFSFDTTGTYSDFVVSPAGTLRFEGSQLTDTIYVDYHGRWDGSIENKIMLSLDGVNDDSISLGNLNSVEANTSLTVELAELVLRYNFPVDNRIEILGELGETVDIAVSFPDGFFPGEVKGQELVIPSFKEFEYTLEQLLFEDDDTEITYRFTLDEALDDDEISYLASFTLGELDDYNLAGNSTYSISKPENIPRDVSVNTAANFYDLSNSNYRTYGEPWFDQNEKDTCKWGAFFAHTYPVVVSYDHPNAVLYDDLGTLDPNDDIYHHAFRIGFNSPIEGNTINSFNLKRWFQNYATNAENSPGFNITQALEFYPDNEGTSTTGGIVKVIEQDLIIATKHEDGSYKSFTISISGEGEYMVIADGIFELSFELRVFSMELFGGTQSGQYRLYNTSEYEEPLPLDVGCFLPIDLRNY